MSTSLSSSPVRVAENASKEAAEQGITKMIEDSITNAANATIAGGFPIDFARDLLAQKVIQVADRIGMARSEIGRAVGRSKSWAYGIPPAPELPSIRDLFLDEHVFDRIQAQGKMSISELAISLSRNESDLKPLIAGMVGTCISIVPGIAPETYEVMDGVIGINHGYPTDPRARCKRMLGADLVARKAIESETYSLCAWLGGSGAKLIYKRFRDYSLELPPEKRLTARLREAKDRGTAAASSRFGAVLLFSPDVDYAGAMAHFVECKNHWCDEHYEMVPYRYPLDDIAIKQFKSEDFHYLKTVLSAELREAQSLSGDGGPRHAYRLSLLHSQYAE